VQSGKGTRIRPSARQKEARAATKRARKAANATPVSVGPEKLVPLFRSGGGSENAKSGNTLPSVMRNILYNFDAHWTRQESRGEPINQRHLSRVAAKQAKEGGPDSPSNQYSTLAEELEGDRLSLAILTVDKLRADKHFMRVEIEKTRAERDNLQVTLAGPDVTFVLDKVNEKCKSELEGSYGNYRVLSQPILTLDDLDELAECLIARAPNVHATLSRLLGLEIRENNARKQLRYKVEQRTVLSVFIALCRVRNSSNAMFWLLLRYASGFARSEPSSVQRFESFFGISTSRTTWERKTKVFALEHEKCISEKLQESDRNMPGFDNSQAGKHKKDQRKGSSSTFWEGMTRVVKRLHIYLGPPGLDLMHSKPPLTFVDQSIPSPIDMPPYEKAVSTDDVIVAIKDPRKWGSQHKSDIDSSGKCMNAYVCLLRTAQILECMHEKASLEDKEWAHMPKEHAESGERRTVMSVLHHTRMGLLRSARKFQQDTVHTWNSFEELADAFAILPLSSRIDGTAPAQFCSTF